MLTEERSVGTVYVIRVLDQKLDFRVAPQLKQRLTECIQTGYCRIALNLEEVHFVDRSALDAIVAALRKVVFIGDIVICGIQESVLNKFKIASMDRGFQMFSDESEAIASFDTAWATAV